MTPFRQSMPTSRLRMVLRSIIGPGLAVVAMVTVAGAAQPQIPDAVAAAPTELQFVAATPPEIVAIVPSSGPIGTQVSIHGSGFTASGNTVIFGAGSRAFASGSVYPNLTSSNGSVIIFTIPAHYDPPCEYSSRPCPFAALPTISGSYSVAVSNINGQSNAQNFIVTAQ
jgi:hypothetical protein